MKKFVILYVGYEEPNEENMKGREAWMNWFESISEHIVDGGNPMANGREIKDGQVTELPLDLNATTGYTLINAESIDAAVELAKDCPTLNAVRVYETFSM